MDIGSGVAGFLVLAQLLLVIVLIGLFIRMAGDVRAIRKILEHPDR
ncbi:MAG: hypothetical protein ACXVQ0_09355 [Actinomycetota bacterium]